MGRIHLSWLTDTFCSFFAILKKQEDETMNYSDIMPRVYDVEDGYNYSVHAVPFISVEDVEKIRQDIPKFSVQFRLKAQQVLDLLLQFPTMSVNMHAHNYSVPSQYVDHYCVVQARPEGREALSHKKTDLMFLTDPLQWKLDCLKQLSKMRTTVEKINEKCKIKINMACVQYAMDLCEKVETGVFCVEAVDMQKMLSNTAYAIFNLTNGGYVNSHLKHACETLNSAEMFPTEVSARNYINSKADYGCHYTIIPIQMQAGPHMEIISRGVPHNRLDERDQEQLALLEKELVLLHISNDKAPNTQTKKSKI